jgi:hypothetical protein
MGKCPDLSQVRTIIYLPQPFSMIVKAVNKKRIEYSYYHELILLHLSCQFSNHMRQFNAIENEFPTEHSTEDWCINVIINENIAIASPPHQHSQNQKKINKANEVKAVWIKKREYQQRVELYLGINDFDSELKRSFGEFYSEL